MSAPRQTFGEYVHRRRRELKLTQRDIEIEISMGKGYLSRLENGLTDVSDEVLPLLARALDVPLDKLAGRAGRGLDQGSFEQQSLKILRQLVDEQQAGFKRIEAALAKLSRA